MTSPDTPAAPRRRPRPAALPGARLVHPQRLQPPRRRADPRGGQRARQPGARDRGPHQRPPPPDAGQPARPRRAPLPGLAARPRPSGSATSAPTTAGSPCCSAAGARRCVGARGPGRGRPTAGAAGLPAAVEGRGRRLLRRRRRHSSYGELAASRPGTRCSCSRAGGPLMAAPGSHRAAAPTGALTPGRADRRARPGACSSRRGRTP